MKKSLISTALISAATLFNLNNAEAAMVKQVSFKSNNQTLAGNLYLPENYKQGDKLPAVVVTGAWTTVKEQMPATYAAKLADNGYAALTFDFRGWGASEGDVKYLEDPASKTADINAAIDYLATRDEVDADKLAGLGICASAGYMSDAAAENKHIKALTLVAPWLHNKEIVEAVYGGKEGVAGLLVAGQNAANAEQPVYIEAASTTNENSLMYQAPYYTEVDRGLIKEYDNKFNVASWTGWLTYDALQTADKQTKPTLMVHSEDAAIPQGAKEYAKRAGDTAELIMLDNVTQFDFYDNKKAVNTSINAVVKHLDANLNLQK
tara:strand:+ start:2372 stop:3334 length:963 start_codon:yes stop_codon:yes gene_type:complete